MNLTSFLPILSLLVSAIVLTIFTPSSGQLSSSSSTPLKLEEIRGFQNLKRENYLSSPLRRGGEVKAWLPTDLTPTHYTLYIRPILDEEGGGSERFTAPGTIEILVTCNQPTSRVTLHKYHDINVTMESIQVVTVPSGDPVKVMSSSHDPDTSFYSLILDSNLVVGSQYKISMDFTSPIVQGSSGLYRAQYTAPDGTIKHMATTQFESTGARMAFPCMDQPDLKATFDISIARTKDRNTLCNTVKVAGGPNEPPPIPDNYVWDHYQRTVVMSPYLVAMVVSDFTCEQADPSIFGPERPVQVCGPPHLIGEGRKGGVYPAEASAKALKWLETKFQHPYDMPQMTSVAIPRNYFAPGAMENWGLVTFKDNYLLYYEGETSEVDRNRIVSIIWHEFAHQWFGNLVTCANWENIWLNEGFATYVAAMMNEVSPEYFSHQEIVWDNIQSAMAFDVGVNQPVLETDPSKSSSSTIIYDKGSSLIRTMEGFLGKNTLTEALIEYLKRFTFKPAKQDQLFQVLTEFALRDQKIPADKTMKIIMDTWTLKSGYPLIRVSKTSQNRVYISQEEFLKSGGQAVTGQNGELWEVPIAMATETNSDFTNTTPAFWLSKNSLAQPLEHDTSKWILLNPNAMSYYRVLYDDSLLALIQKQLDTDLKVISPLSRSQLIDDYFTFAKFGHASIDKALDLTQNLENEDNFVVWYSLFSSLTTSLTMFDNLSEMKMKNYLAPKIEAVLNTILGDPWTTIPLKDVAKGTTTIFTSKMLDWACALDSTKCRQLASELFTSVFDGDQSLTETIPPDYQPIIFCSAVDQLGQSAHDHLLEMYTNPDIVPGYKSRFLNALACLGDATLLKNFLEKQVLAEDCQEWACVSKSDALTLLQAVIRQSAQSRQVIFDILKLNFAQLNDYVGPDAIATIIGGLSSFYKTGPEKIEIENVILTNEEELQTVWTRLETSMTLIESNIEWMTRFHDPMKNWFDAHTTSSSYIVTKYFMTKRTI